MLTWYEINAYSESVYCLSLSFIYILIHGAVVMGILWGKLTPVTGVFRVTKIRENTTQKIHRCTQESHYPLHIGTPSSMDTNLPY